MTYIKIIIIFSLFIFQLACSDSSCDDDDIKYFDIEELTLESPYASPVVAVSHTAVELNFSASKIRYYASNNNQYNLMDFFISHANASCGLSSKEKIHSISISVSPSYFYDDVLDNNMELFFDVTRGLYGETESNTNLSELVKNEVYASREFSIRLNRPPLVTGIYQFFIVYTHSDGERFELLSEQHAIIGGDP